MPSRKRSAPSAKAATAAVATNLARQENMLPRTMPDEPARSATAAAPRMQHRSSFDSVGVSQTATGGRNLSANLQELLPLDLSSAGATSDTSSTPGTAAQRRPSSFQTAQTPTTSSLYKVDAIMFPSGDPFAYPSQQPLLDFGGQARTVSQSQQQQQQQQQQDAIPFYGVYDDIEGQLLGPVPGYLQHGLDLSAQTAQMYNTSGVLILNQQQQQLAQQQQRHQRDMEQFLSDPSFRGDWGDFLGDGGGGYRPL